MENNILLTEEEIQKRLYELALEIDNDYKNTRELTVITIMHGAMHFSAALTMKMKTNLKFEAITLKSYDGKHSTGDVTKDGSFKESIEGKDILIIEDIVDTGTSMRYFLDYLKKQNPSSIKLCTLVHKNKGKNDEASDIKIDYNGFNIEDKFIVGFGLDYNGLYRNLPYIMDATDSKLVKKK